MAVQWAECGITVNSISPNTTRTPMFDHSMSTQPGYKQKAMKIATKKAAGPEEIANIVAFLSSPQSTQITGINIKIDGGLTAIQPMFL